MMRQIRKKTKFGLVFDFCNRSMYDHLVGRQTWWAAKTAVSSSPYCAFTLTLPQKIAAYAVFHIMVLTVLEWGVGGGWR